MTRQPDPSFDPTPDQPLGFPAPVTTASDALALAIVWSRTEPSRVGECVLLTSRPTVIGRGGPRPEDHGERAVFAAMRPGRTIGGGPLAAPNMSRLHVRLAPDADAIAFERTGKGPVELDGVLADQGVLAPGGSLLLANEVLLLCDRRSAQMPDSSLTRTPDFPFGHPDAWRLTGETAITWRLRDHIRFAAGSGSPLLVVGAPGSGKDMVARAVHAASASRQRPYVLVGGATLTRADLEALQARSDAPFVVIDEVSDVAPEVQPFLSGFIALNDRLPPPRLRIVATNSGPLSVLGHGATAAPADAIRADLASRFIHTLRVPGLDERRADVPLLARAILREIAAEQPEIGARFFEGWDPAGTSGEPRFTPALVGRLVRHRWTSHLRELTALLWTAMTSAVDARLDATPEVLAQLDTIESPFADPNKLDAQAIREALDQAHGKVAVAARALGLKNRWVLYRLMDKLDIEV